jgi:serine/threonine protein kinase
MSKRLTTIGSNYILKERLGRGSFGEVYACEDRLGRKYAAKLEQRRKSTGKRRKGPSQLEYENRCYSLLEGTGLPTIYDYFTYGDYNVLIMDRLGHSIQNVLEKSPSKKLPMDSVLAVGMRILCHLEIIHCKGMLHRDVKPQNFCLGRDQDREIYIIDFGLAKKYVQGGGKHIVYRDNKSGLTGTPRFASINSHLGIEQSRRDDLESLAYVLIYLSRGTLPWIGLGGKRRVRSDDDVPNRHEMILRVKQATTDTRLCKGLPKGLCQFVKTVRGLKFYETPPYDQLYNMLNLAYEESVKRR